MSVFEQLQPSFTDPTRPTLQTIRQANAAYPPDGVRMQVIRLQDKVTFWLFLAWRDGRPETFVGEVLASTMAEPSDDRTCLFLGELMTIDDETASAVARQADQTTRASYVRDLGRMEHGTSLYMWADGTDQFANA